MRRHLKLYADDGFVYIYLLLYSLYSVCFLGNFKRKSDSSYVLSPSS